MSTRAQIRFATREAGISFNEHPEKIHAQFYKHSDGYPEGLGLDIAMSIIKNDSISGWEIESLDAKHGDLEYVYYVWQKPDDATWVSIFEVGWETPCECCGSIKTEDQWEDKCIFVGTPVDLINKYKQNTNDDG
tara:strand:- start:414 stop:815 length:402 start_codon:yes stop_codon:yes gene_type:complete